MHRPLKLGHVNTPDHRCVCRVPEECPQSILELYLACISSDPRKRPTAMEIMLAVEGALVQIPGAVPAVPPSAADQALPKEHESWV